MVSYQQLVSIALKCHLLQVLLDGVLAKPDSSIWELPYLTADDLSILNGARGVPAHLIPANASAKNAKPKIISSRGYQLPPDVPGLMTSLVGIIGSRGTYLTVTTCRHNCLVLETPPALQSKGLLEVHHKSTRGCPAAWIKWRCGTFSEDEEVHGLSAFNSPPRVHTAACIGIFT